MGSHWSSGRSSTEEADVQVSSGAYRYPPKSGGAYFSNHFIMGGEKFDSPRPEAFLFGENTDLNFLGLRPAPFPYPPPQATEPTKTLRSLINVRRDSLHFVLVPGSSSNSLPTTSPPPPRIESEEDDSEEGIPLEQTQNVVNPHQSKKFRIEFTFDSDVRCSITIYYFCTEEIGAQAATYTPREAHLKSETFFFKRGANQVFSQPTHMFQPGLYTDQELTFGEEGCGTIPVAIQCVALDGDSPHQSHTTLAAIERSSDGSYMLKALKQKLFVDGLSYLLQEIYGLENKNSDSKAGSFDDDVDDCGADCVVCMCDLRDTIILPCRHLCLCYACAESLRYQANNCPICRAPFIALLQIRAVQRISHATHPALAGSEPAVQEGVPLGYTGISLVEALNGPGMVSQPQQPPLPPPVMTLAPKIEERKKSRGKRRGTRQSMTSSTSAEPVESPSENVNLNQEQQQQQQQAESNVKVTLKIVNEVEKRPNTPPTSVDLVDEELANMAVAESFEDEPQVGSDAKLDDIDDEDEDDDDEEDEDDIEDEDEDEEEEEEEGLEEDAAVVVQLPLASKRILSSLPGTPTSNTSARSSQDSSSSSASTKQLLPTKASASSSATSASQAASTPVQCESTIVKVVPTADEEEMC